MDGNQLKYFLALASIHNFTKASEELNLSQPALSRSISRLEEEIGAPLFERKGRGVVLNHYGEILLQHARRALWEIDEAERKISKMIDPSHGTILLGFIQTLGLSFVPELISNFQKQAPGVKFQLTQGCTKKILSQIESGKIDIGFCSPQAPNENLSYLPIMEEELFLIVPKDHRLAGCKDVDLSAVANDPFILFNSEITLQDVIEKLCRESGFEPIKSLEAFDVWTVAGLVGSNFGVSLIPSIPGLNNGKISIVRVRKPQCSIVNQMVWRTNGYMSPAVTRFKSFIENLRNERQTFIKG